MTLLFSETGDFYADVNLLHDDDGLGHRVYDRYTYKAVGFAKQMTETLIVGQPEQQKYFDKLTPQEHEEIVELLKRVNEL
jgi:hypothetical protein